MTKEPGIIVGQLGDKLLVHRGNAMRSPHAILTAPTGSGKTQGIMLPNLLAWPHSVAALDLKGELYTRTAGYRSSHGQKTYRLNFTPRDYRTHRYNPFAFVSSDPNFLVADVERITNYLIQLGKGDDFWPKEARRLFIALALYLYSTGETPTLPRIRALALVGADGTGLQRWCKTVSKDADKKATLHPEAWMSLTNFASSADNTVGGVVQTVTAGLAPFLNDLTASVVSGNDIPLDRLREQSISIYLVVQPSDIEQLSPIVRLFWQQLVDLNTDSDFGTKTSHKNLVLMAMDEFATVGKIPAVQQGIAYVRSYGLRILAIAQSDAQVEGVYERSGAKAFSDNFGASIHYTPAAKDLESAERVSKLLGNKTVKGQSKSRRTGWFGGDASRSETESDQRRALMLPQEVLRLPVNELILFVSGMHPIRARKPFAAKDKRFASRVATPPEVPLLDVVRLRSPGEPSAELSADVAAPLAPTMVPIDAATIGAIEQFDLSDFSLDFSDVIVPKEPASQAEIDALCNQVLDRAMGRTERDHSADVLEETP
jgi:type IV secretion system protein VirD4